VHALQYKTVGHSINENEQQKTKLANKGKIAKAHNVCKNGKPDGAQSPRKCEYV
jgi:hypothetical protein